MKINLHGPRLPLGKVYCCFRQNSCPCPGNFAESAGFRKISSVSWMNHETIGSSLFHDYDEPLELKLFARDLQLLLQQWCYPLNRYIMYTVFLQLQSLITKQSRNVPICWQNSIRKLLWSSKRAILKGLKRRCGKSIKCLFNGSHNNLVIYNERYWEKFPG